MTTQIPQYLHEGSYTYPRRIVDCILPSACAARRAATRVAQEMGVRLGHEVGYATESEDCSSAETILKYMTDAAHLHEAALQPDLASYSVIILDQAHERPWDVLFRLARAIVVSRPSLKLLIASSTIEM
ncbi:hypothetical protein L7F22_023737 [Adiantum nelumboides]|nr:hypothetical protein [Adiantum nelumboides]